MAKGKIIWSNRAKKRLYGILEYSITRNKSKTYSIKLYKLLKNEIKLLAKYHDLGLRTTDDSIRGLIIEDFIICYELTRDRIIIHTIHETRQSSYTST